MSEKTFAATMLGTAKKVQRFSGTGSNLWTRDRDGFEQKEVHRSYPYDGGRFFLANLLCGRKIGKKIVFTNGAF